MGHSGKMSEESIYSGIGVSSAYSGDFFFSYNFRSIGIGDIL